MSGAVEKTLAIIEYLAERPDGATLVAIATDLRQSRSGCHRALHELARYGYVRVLPRRGEYALTTKLTSMGLSFLSKSGIIDIAQPVLDRLARRVEELVRLAIVDGERLTLVAKSQGARTGLRYDPDMGIELRLSCSAAGQAWLATLPDEAAIEAVVRQGMGRPEDYGPAAPTTMRTLLAALQAHRDRGFSMVRDAYAPGMTAMAAAVQRRGESASGVVVIAGPSVRATPERLLSFGADLLKSADELALLGSASPLLRSARLGTWGNRGTA